MKKVVNKACAYLLIHRATLRKPHGGAPSRRQYTWRSPPQQKGKTRLEKKVAAVETKDGEKIINPPAKKKTKPSATETGEEESDGSANAFEATERVQDEE